jgi:hypothetical protein
MAGPKNILVRSIDHTTKLRPEKMPVTYPYWIAFLQMFNMIPKYAMVSKKIL